MISEITVKNGDPFFIGGLKYFVPLYQAHGMLPKREEPNNRNKFLVRIPVWFILKIQTALMALAAKNDSIMCSAFYPKFGPWYFDKALISLKSNLY